MTRLASLAAPLMTLTSISVAAAHPGHGVSPDSHGPLHYLFEPQHGGALVLLAAATGLAAWALVQLLRRRAEFTTKTRRAPS